MVTCRLYPIQRSLTLEDVAGAFDSSDTSGGERFDILRKLGSGGMGIVYEAFDRERDTVVALKTLRRLDPGALYRFKKEFRSLADIAHPNLVTLHELVSSGEEWFFTMELIRGVNFLQHVRPATTSEDADTWHDSEGPPVSVATLRIESDEDAIGDADTALEHVPVHPGDLDISRLREALEQLTKGVIGLHSAGRLHRDIKPSNVLVTREGRVVLCDFGLATEISRDEPYSTSDEHVAGTVPYRSPEQAASGSLDEASDWYSVGVVLYEALTARVPFESQGRDALRLKQVMEPPAPSELESGIPPDLDQLCRDLLRIEPERRPCGGEILERLSCQTPLPTRSTMARLSQPPVPLVGREKELAALRTALDDSASGHAVEVRVHGSSGIGKTALVRQFLDELVQSDAAVVLTGRCYERESIPYNALDSLMDRLSTYLVRLPGAAVEEVMPRDVVALARLFPVLRRVEAAAVPQQRGFVGADPQESRRRAFYALRELLDNLAQSRPLALFIDDLQWADADSVALLEELMRPPGPPPLLLITAHRAEDAATDPFKRPRRRRATTRHEIVDAREIFLESLPPAKARELALALFGSEDAEARAHADTIAAESGGSPFLVYSLVRHVMAGSSLDREGAGKATLAEVLRARIEKLPPMARSVLEAVAVADRPITRAVVESTVGTETDAQRTLAVLRAEHLLRTQRLKAQDSIETYHDSIRQAVIEQLSPEDLKNYHLRLARALHAVGQADPEELVEHWLAGGERGAAGDDALVAGDQAVRALAFGRAALQYQRALELKEMPRNQEREAQTKLGDALANAGRGAEAARAYLAAAEGAAAGAVLDLQRRAALQLLRGGHVDEGLAALSHVLYMVGMELPPTARSAVTSLVVNRARLLLRGLRFRERDASLLTAHQLARIDICWSAAVGLAMVDPVRSAYFQAWQLRLALRAGEPYRVARALSVEVPVAALSGERGRRRAQRATLVAKELAESLDEPILHAWLVAGTALLEYQTGHFRAARNAAEQAVSMLRDDCVGVVWEVTSAELYLLWSLFYLGELDKMSLLAQRLLEDAWQRGDDYAAASLRMGLTNSVWLMVDDPEDARRQVSEAMGSWSRQGFHLQHYWEVLALANCDLYEGEGRSAYVRITETWKRLRESLLLRVELVRVEAIHLRARAALAAASQATDPSALWKEALAMARRLERAGWARPFAAIVRAGVAVGRGQMQRAEALFERAEKQFAAADMALYEAAARYRRGEILGGDEGCALMDQVDAWMLGQSIENAERMVDLLAPSPVP